MMTSTFLLSCAGSRKVEVAEIKTVRSFALTNFSAMLPSSALSSNAAVKNSEDIDQMYEALNQKLSSFLKAKSIKRSALVANEHYVKAYDGTMKGFQNKNIDMSSMRYEVVQIMDSESMRLLDTTGRDQLMKALNVDAIVSAEVRVVLDGFTVAGIGTRKPQAHVLMQMYKKGIEAPVWFETFIGDAASESVGATKFINENKLRELSLASFRSAIAKMTFDETKK